MSVLDQTFSDWEMIIVDYCSVDHPETIISGYTAQDKRIRYVRLEKKHGAAAARNIAINLAKADFIAFLDSDDVFKPNKLEIQVGLMRKNNWAFSFTGYEIIDQDGVSTRKTIHVPSEIDYQHYLRNTIIGCLTVMIDRKQTGSFQMPEIRSSHDMALWLDLMKRGFKAYGIDEILSSYRLVATSNTANKLKAAKDVWHVYRKIEKLSFIYSLYNFTGYVFHAILKRM